MAPQRWPPVLALGLIAASLAAGCLGAPVAAEQDAFAQGAAAAEHTLLAAQADHLRHWAEFRQVERDAADAAADLAGIAAELREVEAAALALQHDAPAAEADSPAA